jgi:von Willebrand factor type A domain/HEAT repeats
MRRPALVALLLAGLLAAGEKRYSLKELLDPLEPDFALSAYTWADWETLDQATRLKARGSDPAEWEVPPADPETPEEKTKREEREKRLKADPPKDRVPGFRFDRRLELKRKAFEDLLGAASAPKLEGLIKQLKLLDKELARFDKDLDETREAYFQVAEQYRKAQEAYSENYKKKHGVWPETVPMSGALIADFNQKSLRFQGLLAARQSELQFHDWLLGRVGELVSALTDAEADKPLAALAAGMKDSDFAYRIRCVELLARLKGGKATALYEQSLAQESDPLVLAELIRLKAKWGGPGGAFDLLAARLDDPAWPVRAAIVRELSRIPRKESIDLLVARLAKEDGRLKDDITEALRALTGQNFVAEAEPWRIWWEKSRAGWVPPQERSKDDTPGEGQAKGVVYFYGIRSSSKRVVFCLDVSGSMEWSLAGQNEKGPPRLDKAKQELLQALNGLPEDAQFTIVVYSSDVRTWKKSLEPASAKNKASAQKFVEDLKPEGATNIFDALVTAMEIAAPPAKGRDPGADTIFFMTDGQPTHGKLIDPHQIIDEVTRRNRVLGVTLHTVGVSKEQNSAFLLNLAKRNGGRYVAYK